MSNPLTQATTAMAETKMRVPLLTTGLPFGTRVRVYRNLRNKLLSVQAFTRGTGWRVVGHVDQIALANVAFRVSEAGRRRVLAERRKNVHAFVVGTVAATTGAPAIPVRYSPYEAGSFLTVATRAPVTWAAFATVTPHAILVSV